MRLLVLVLSRVERRMCVILTILMMKQLLNSIERIMRLGSDARAVSESSFWDSLRFRARHEIEPNQMWLRGRNLTYSSFIIYLLYGVLDCFVISRN